MWKIAPVDEKSKIDNIDNLTIVSAECREEIKLEQELINIYNSISPTFFT